MFPRPSFFDICAWLRGAAILAFLVGIVLMLFHYTAGLIVLVACVVLLEILHIDACYAPEYRRKPIR